MEIIKCRFHTASSLVVSVGIEISGKTMGAWGLTDEGLCATARTDNGRGTVEESGFHIHLL
jgi:hypothetical protein